MITDSESRIKSRLLTQHEAISMHPLGPNAVPSLLTCSIFSYLLSLLSLKMFLFLQCHPLLLSEVSAVSMNTSLTLPSKLFMLPSELRQYFFPSFSYLFYALIWFGLVFVWLYFALSSSKELNSAPVKENAKCFW